MNPTTLVLAAVAFILLADRADGAKPSLDVAGVVDHIELAEASARLKAMRPVRSKSGMRHPGGSGQGVAAFTPDGAHLATVAGDDVRLWRTNDWSLAAPPILLDGSIERLAFSPDCKHLYVAGGGGGLQVHARYDWKAGKLDRAYVGHRSGVARLLLSADGRTMATSNYYEDTIHVWDTDTGRILQTFETPRLAHQIALSAGGTTLLRRIAVGSAKPNESKTRWTVEALRPGALKIPKNVLDGNPALFAFSADGKHFLAVGHEDGSGERAVRLYDIRDGFREVGRTTVSGLPPHRITFHSKLNIVLIEGHWTDSDAHALTLPDLKPVKGFEKLERKCNEFKSVCLSPDGKLLAVGVLFRPTPHLFRTDTFEELLPYEGHGENVAQVFFPGAGVVRTLGRDHTICTWDARTLKMLRRQSLPDGWNQESAREPDGRYLIGSAKTRDGRELQVFDVESDRVVARVTMPSDFFSSLDVAWVNEREVYAIEARELCHFDVTTGKVLARRKIDLGLHRRMGLTEDGKDFYIVEGGIPKYPNVRPRRINVESGKETAVGRIDLRTFTGNDAGLVPGGKYFYVGDPGFYLFDRRTLELVTSRAFRGTSSLSLAFTRDGARFAVVTGRQIRIHDTPTGRTLGAFPTSTRSVSVTFSPDGNQLAVMNDDGTFELWDLSKLTQR